MAKLKIITMTMLERPDMNALYKAIDDDGNVIATRSACKSCKGTTWIAALITRNIMGSRTYTIKSLFAEFHRISRKGATKTQQPYAIAIREDMKEAFEQWRAAKRQRKQKVKPTIDDYAKPLVSHGTNL